MRTHGNAVPMVFRTTRRSRNGQGDFACFAASGDDTETLARSLHALRRALNFGLTWMRTVEIVWDGGRMPGVVVSVDLAGRPALTFATPMETRLGRWAVSSRGDGRSARGIYRISESGQSDRIELDVTIAS